MSDFAGATTPARRNRGGRIQDPGGRDRPDAGIPPWNPGMFPTPRVPYSIRSGSNDRRGPEVCCSGLFPFRAPGDPGTKGAEARPCFHTAVIRPRGEDFPGRFD